MASATGEEPAPSPLDLMGGLLENVRTLVGDKAGSALIRFAAVQEGQRIGASYGRDQLPAALARFDGMVAQHTEVVENGPRQVRLHLHPGPKGLGAGDGILLGLLEGLMQGIYGKRYEGSLVMDSSGDGATAELVVSDHA